jgi:predicted signal transduction protein with EAL and GGDEF domain
MITDPPTTPSSPRAQLAFGLAVAATYGLLMINHIVFGLFFALVIVCAIRGSWLWVTQRGVPAPETT